MFKYSKVSVTFSEMRLKLLTKLIQWWVFFFNQYTFLLYFKRGPFSYRSTYFWLRPVVTIINARPLDWEKSPREYIKNINLSFDNSSTKFSKNKIKLYVVKKSSGLKICPRTLPLQMIKFLVQRLPTVL